MSGFPIPSISWYVNGRLINETVDSRVNIRATNSPDLIPGFQSDGSFSGSGFSEFNFGSGSASGIQINDSFGTVSSRLMISNVLMSDSGRYRCVVSNMIYSDVYSERVLVSVRGNYNTYNIPPQYYGKY